MGAADLWPMMPTGRSDRIVARNEPGSEPLSKPISDERQSARFSACRVQSRTPRRGSVWYGDQA